MADLFVSYTRVDATRASEVAVALRKAGYSVFYDESLITGDSWDRRIESELEMCAAVIVLWSPSARERQWVRNEARFAMSRGILCPALIETCSIPVEFSHVQTADLRQSALQPGDKGWQDLLQGIGKIVPAPIPATLPPTLLPPHSSVPAKRMSSALTTETRSTARSTKAWIGVGAVATIVGILVGWLAHRSDPSPSLENTTIPQETPKLSESIKGADIPRQTPPVVVGQAKSSEEKPHASPPPAHTGKSTTPKVITGSLTSKPGIKPATVPVERKTTTDYVAFDLDMLHPDVRTAVERARDAESRGRAVAKQARGAEQQAEKAAKNALNNVEGTKDHHYEGTLYTYSGDWSDGKPNGYGVFSKNPSDPTSERWAGEFRGRPNGLTVHFWMQHNERRQTLAQFREGKANGVGVLMAANAGEYAGEFRDDEWHGFGVYRFPNGSRVEGEWSGGVTGRGVEWTADGHVKAAGIWKGGKLVTSLAK